MKLLKLLGAMIAVACISAFPVSAMAAPLAFDPAGPSIQVIDDCSVASDLSGPALFVTAYDSCHVQVAEMTGLCLEKRPVGDPDAAFAAVIVPTSYGSCTLIRPSPPG